MQSQSKGALQSKVSNQENKSLKARLKINKIETKAMQINANNLTCLKEVSHWQSVTFGAKLKNLMLQTNKV